jgi:hypothetical protein
MLVLALSSALITSCSISPPKPTPCTIINGTVAQCVPSETADPIYDRPIARMRGYMCFSPDDIAEIKIYIKKILEEIRDE